MASADGKNPQTPGTKYRDKDGSIKVYGAAKTTSTSTRSSEGSSDYASADNTLARQEADRQALLNRQSAEKDAALNSYRSTVAGLEKPEDIFARISGEQGIPGMQESTKALRQRAADIEALLARLPADVTNRMEGTMATESQRQRVVAKEQAPIAGDLSGVLRGLGVESGNLADAMAMTGQLTSLTTQGQERTLEPERLAISQLSERAARELTSFNSGREQELTLLMSKIQRNQQLSDQEWQRANDLADQATQFEQLRDELKLRSQLDRESSGYGSDREKDTVSFERDKELARLEASLRPASGGGTGSERAMAKLQGIAPQIEATLGSDRNVGETQGSFTTIAAYRNAKNQALSAGVSPDDFDSVYGERLSGNDRIRYGIGSTTNIGQLQEAGGGTEFDRWLDEQLNAVARGG